MRHLLIPVAVAAFSHAAYAEPNNAAAQSGLTVTPPVAAATAPTAVAAAEATVAPTAPAQLAAVPQVTLPANSEFKVALVESMSSKKTKLGDKFKLITLADVSQGDAIVIPKGTPGEGHVSFRGGGGSFGKSGKLEIAFDSLQLNGRMVPIAGKYRDEGKGNGGAATGAVLAAGLIGGLFVHGHSAKIEKDQPMTAHIVDALTIDAVPAAAR